MDRSSAFRKEICHKGQHIPIDPPIVHMSAYTKGGLHRLFQQIAHPEKVSFPIYEYGQFTNETGHFCPVLGVVMASRYRVRQVISRQGQSAILLLAEDLFCHKKHVVIKVLHASRYQLGAQETHCLWRLALADPWGNSNTVHYLNTFTFDDHYCIVFKPLVPLSLTEICQDIPSLKVIHSIRKIAVRLLSTLGFLWQQNVIHADLKPENILLRDRNDLSSVTVIDFGNAIQHVHKEIALYYDDFELQTPLYRAPEVMFGMPFGKEIDMWSLGCILAELYLSKPLFMGNSKIDIMQQITSLLGPFPGRTFQRGKFYSSFRQFTDTVEQPDATELLLTHLGCRDYLLADFLAGLLRYNPDERMTPFEAAKHSFLAPEFPFGYLLSPSSEDSGAAYSAVHLTNTKYKHRPTVAADIRRSKPSTYDILSLGTTLSEEEEVESLSEFSSTPNKQGKVAKVVPVQREQSLGKIQKDSVERTLQHNDVRNRGTVDSTRTGLTNGNNNRKENLSPSSLNETRNKRRVHRNQQEYVYHGEANQPSNIQRDRYQNHALAKRRRERAEKKLSTGHRSCEKNDQFLLAQQVGHSPSGGCNNILFEPTEGERIEAVCSGSPAFHRSVHTEEGNNSMKHDDGVSSHSTVDRKKEERCPFGISSVSKGKRLKIEGSKMQRKENQDGERLGDNESDQFQFNMENDQLVWENNRRREVTPNSHHDQVTSRNVDGNRRCQYDFQNKKHQGDKEHRSISRSRSEFKDLNETFVVKSDSPCTTTASVGSRNQSSMQQRSLNDQHNEIIRPCPGWFSRRGKGESVTEKFEEQVSARGSLYQKPTAMSELTVSQVSWDGEHVSDSPDTSVIRKYVDGLPESNTVSQHQQRGQTKQTQRLDSHGKMMQHQENVCQAPPGCTRRKLLHIRQSPALMSHESSVNLQPDLDKPSKSKTCHQESPRQSTQNARQLASLMKAIREEQDLAEQDLSEKESGRYIKHEVDRAFEGLIDSNNREVRFPEKPLSSKMYDSVSEDEVHSFDEITLNDIESGKCRKSGYDSCETTVGVGALKQCLNYNNLQRKRHGYNHPRSKQASTSHSPCVKEEKYIKAVGSMENSVDYWEKIHSHESSSVRCSASSQNLPCSNKSTSFRCSASSQNSPCSQKSSSVQCSAFGQHLPCNEDSTDIYKSAIHKVADTQNILSEKSGVSIEEMKPLKTEVKCKSESRPRSYDADIYDRACKGSCDKVFTLNQKDSKGTELSGIACNNQSGIDRQRICRTQDRNFHNNYTDITSASQKFTSDKHLLIESEDGFSSTSSTKSAQVVRSNKQEMILPARYSTTTKSNPSAETQESDLLESDSCKQVFQSKVQVKKIAKKRLNFTQALKPLKGNKTKVKAFSKSRTTPVTNQQSTKRLAKSRTNRKEEDPYVFLITPEKSLSSHSKQSVIEKSASGKKRKKRYSQIVSEENLNEDLDEPLGKYYRRKNSMRREANQSRQGQMENGETTKSREEVISKEKLVHQSKLCSTNSKDQGYSPDSESMHLSVREMQSSFLIENKTEQTHKRKAASHPRTSMKRQKQSDKWNNYYNDNISSEELGMSLDKNGVEIQNSSEKFDDSEEVGKLEYEDVEKRRLHNVSQSKKYKNERTRAEDCNYKEECSVYQYSTNQPEHSVTQKIYKKGHINSKNVVKSSKHPHRSPRKSQSVGHQHTHSEGLDSVGEKSVASRRCNLVAIRKSKSIKSINNISKDVNLLYHLGESERDYKYATVTEKMLPRAGLHQQNIMSGDSSEEEGTKEDGSEMYSSDSEEVLLV
ncbi:uncharacterized protein LOC132560913 [Ylistrum balloti]|uniref:uncharacterized protein LOC132560913 n=1 Tax=Ylistrum balloti TaxID=509963 RepID=UPI002905DE55|nr:uncharacterized protein LOC132560913 [Ylistrum balloti]